MEFRKEVQLLSQRKPFDDIKARSVDENIFGASKPARAAMIQSTLTARIQNMDPSLYPLFMESDVATQKLYALTGSFAHDTLFFDFMYEVVREKMDERTISKTKEMFDNMHKRKIDMADSIYVINVGEYIWESTQPDIEYAINHGKSVFYLEDNTRKE